MTTKEKPTESLGAFGGPEKQNKRSGLSDNKPTAKRDVWQGARQYRDSQGRVIAWLRGTTLVKHVDASRHMLRVPPAWAFDALILEAATADGAIDCEVFDRETGDTWRAKLSDFYAHGFNVARGYGRQTALGLAYFCIQRAGTPVQLALL